MNKCAWRWYWNISIQSRNLVNVKCQFSADILRNIKNDSNCLKHVITCDEPLFLSLQRYPNMRWSPTQRKCDEHSKQWNLIFFNIWRIINVYWRPESQTVNQNYYIEVSRTLLQRVRRKSRNVRGMTRQFLPIQYATCQDFYKTWDPCVEMFTVLSWMFTSTHPCEFFVC